MRYSASEKYYRGFNGRLQLAEARPWCYEFKCLLSGKQTLKTKISASANDPKQSLRFKTLSAAMCPRPSLTPRLPALVM